MKKGITISIVNQKGGVGKTTTAVNLASYLSELNNKVLLIDFDPQSNASSAIGIKKNKIKENVYDLIINNSNYKEIIYPTAFKNLDIIPASTDLAAAEIEMVDKKNREFILKTKIDPLKQYYDYIIIDCAPSLGLLTINALTASNQSIVPVQCEYFALEGISQLINTLRLIQKGLNPNLKIAGILLTMVDIRTSLNRSVIDNIKEYFDELVFDTMIPRNIRLAEAPSHGLPIALYKPECKGSISYLKLAKETMKRVN